MEISDEQAIVLLDAMQWDDNRKKFDIAELLAVTSEDCGADELENQIDPQCDFKSETPISEVCFELSRDLFERWIEDLKDMNQVEP
jgi:hypothetical protein